MRLIIICISIVFLVSCRKEYKEVESALWIVYNLDGETVSVEGNEVSSRSVSFSGAPYIWTNNRFIEPYNPNSVDSTQCEFECSTLDTNGNFVWITFRNTLPDYFFEGDSNNLSFKSFNDFRNLFDPGSVEFVKSSGYYFPDGVIVYYQDKDNVVYNTGYDYPNNTNGINSSFEITAAERFYSFEHEKDGLRVFAKFSATLYREPTDSIRIENADCALLFVP